MAFNVHVIGPEFLIEENTRAFLRMEESVRQFSAHSRESIYLVRRPLELTEDHFVLLWPHGTMLVGLYPYAGVIRGRRQGDWENEPTPKNPLPPIVARRALRLREDRRVEALPNPYASLAHGRHELAELLDRAVLEPKVVQKGATVTNGKEQEVVAQSNTRPVLSDEDHIAIAAVFTGAVKGLDIPPIGDPLFSALTVDDAIVRSMVHTPNLLRLADIPGISLSNLMVGRISETLERAARTYENTRSSQSSKAVPISALSAGHPHRPWWWRSDRYWIITLLLLVVLIVFYSIRSFIHPAPAPAPTVRPPTVPRTPSEIVIHTPIESELFISPFMFRTRDQLDHALTYGEGLRFLPDTEQIVVMDSLTLAKGVYGYFKVDDSWRKGKLLQTLQHADTISVVRFLDPLP